MPRRRRPLGPSLFDEPPKRVRRSLDGPAVRAKRISGLDQLAERAHDEWAGRKARDEGIERARRAVDHEWIASAWHLLAELIKTGRPFTTDDILDVVGDPPKGDPRVLGALIIDAARKKRIAGTGRYIPSRRASCHARPKKEWVGA